MVDVLLAGDFYSPRAQAPYVAENVKALIRGAEHALVNLEAPVTASTQRISKSGPAIASHPSSLEHLRDVGFTGVVTANNHILDAGRVGLRDTLDACQAVGFGQTGVRVAGHPLAANGHLDLELASGESVRVLAYCEHEWSVASGDSALGWSVVTAARAVAQSKALGHRVIVVLHGGNEYFPLPRPQLREELRFIAESGADAVVMHHNHMPSAYEIWRGVPICYGIGNFQFDMENPHVEWYQGLLVGLTFEKSRTRLTLTPTVLTDSFEVHLATEEIRDQVLNQVEGYRLQVESDTAHRALWSEYAGRTGRALLRVALQQSRSRPAAMAAEAWIARGERRPEDLLVLTNALQCESLREVLTDYLKDQVQDAVGWGA